MEETTHFYREMLLRHWDAVDMLAVDLLQFGWTPGNEAHRIIRQAACHGEIPTLKMGKGLAPPHYPG